MDIFRQYPKNEAVELKNKENILLRQLADLDQAAEVIGAENERLQKEVDYWSMLQDNYLKRTMQEEMSVYANQIVKNVQRLNQISHNREQLLQQLNIIQAQLTDFNKEQHN